MTEDSGRFISFPRYVSLKIVLIYLILGGFWILFSDTVVSWYVTDARTLSLIQTIKGWLYIVFTALLLYFMIRANIKGYVHAQQKLEGSFQQLKQQSQRLAEVNRALADFTDSVANNLRTPLWRISGFCEALDEELSDVEKPAAHKYIGAVVDNIRQMNQLINDTLKLASLESTPLVYDAIDLSAIAAHISGALGINAPTRSVEWRIERGLSARGDHRLLEELLYRLIDNAWKFTSVRDRAVIEFGRDRERQRRPYFVRDNGIGFNASLAKTIFAPYQRTGSMVSQEGAGLGLAIAQIAVKRHEGEIWAESDSDHGTTIWFTLPE